MLKIYSNDDRFMVMQVKDALENAGIPCFIKNEFASGAIGELSPFDAWPEVWLSDGEWQQRAEKIIADLMSQNTQKPGWLCRHCNESNEGSFELCWQCGKESPIT